MMMQAQDIESMADIEERNRVDRIAKAWKAYYGQSPKPLKMRKTERTDDNVRLNFGRLIVDIGVATLFGDEMRVEAPDDAPDAVQETLDRIIRTNGGDLLWQRLGLSGAIGGTMFYRLQQREDGSVRILCLDPESVEVFWDADDYEKVTKYVVTWHTIDEVGMGVARRQIVKPDGGGWIIIDQQAIEGGWRTLEETPWPYPFAPIGHAQNMPSPHEVYGISDLEPDVLQLIHSIERVASNINRVVRLYAHPRTWGKMIGESLIIDANPGSVLRLEHPNAELHNLEMQSDLASSIDLYGRLVSALHETTRVPEIATGKLDNTGSLSGLALKILYAPLIQKTESKRRTYGHGIQEMMRRALYLSGFSDEIIVEIHWCELVPTDPEAERRTAIIDSQLGVSKATILRQLGYDPEIEAGLAADENADYVAESARAFNAGNDQAV